MVRVFFREGKNIKKVVDLDDMPENNAIVWVDLQNVSNDDEEWIESHFGLNFQTDQEIVEIESSSRYLERNGTIVANSNFLKANRKEYENNPISFQLKNEILFTNRDGDSKVFADTVKKLRISSGAQLTGADILLRLFETQIDLEADLVESIAKAITSLNKKLMADRRPQAETILVINELQEQSMLLREGIIDKQRVLSALIRSLVFPENLKERLKIILKDIQSLLEYTSFNFDRLEYLQDTLMSLINLEQNQIIKIFTLFTIIFLPPTLIAGIFGMNFSFIPTLDKTWGFYLSLIYMGLSSGIILIYFRRKSWI